MEIFKDGKLIPVKVWCNKVKVEDRIILGKFDVHPEISEYNYKSLACLGVLYLTTNDFEGEDYDYIFHDTHSYQIRPKVIHKNGSKLFINTNEGRVYLDQNYIDWIKLEFPEYGKLL